MQLEEILTIMAKGKQTCKILKEIRKQIAAENDIEFVTSECTYKGDCLGTCPKCEAEVRYLEHELEKRQRLGKAAVFAGMSLGTLLTAAACDTTVKVASNPNCPNGSDVAQCDSIPERRLEGDVVATVREPQKPDTNNVVITDNDVMGLVMMYTNYFEFNAEDYKALMKDKFVFPEMQHLSVISGNIEYRYVGDGERYENLEQFIQGVEEFRAPYYSGGEQKMLDDLAALLKLDASKYKGDMEVAFTVPVWGDVKDVEVVKGINKALDEAVAEAMTQMGWNSGLYDYKDADIIGGAFECRCVQKIHFPIKTK